MKGHKFDLDKAVINSNDLPENVPSQSAISLLVHEADTIQNSSSSSLTPSASMLDLSEQSSKSKKHILDLKEGAQRKRFSGIMGTIKEFADEEDITSTKVYSYGSNSKYLTSKSVSVIGKKLFYGDYDNDDIGVEIALSIFNKLKLTKRQYIDMRIILKNNKRNIFPTDQKIKEYSDSITPNINQITSASNIGVKFDYIPALSITTERILRNLNSSLLQNLSEIKLEINDGLDGSSGHSIYNQIGSPNTTNIILYMFRIATISSGDVTLWESPAHGSASYSRPILLLPGKETYKNSKFVADLQRERKNVEFELNFNGLKIQVELIVIIVPLRNQKGMT